MLIGRVLLVEHDSALRTPMVEELVKAHLQVDVAGDEDEAIALLSENRYDVLLLDWMLSESKSVLAYLRGATGVRARVVILLSDAERTVLRKIDRNVVKAILFKPVDLPVLASSVRLYCTAVPPVNV